MLSQLQTGRKKQVVFCDFDGPIVDVSERYYRTYRKGLKVIAAVCDRETNQTIATTPLSKEQFWHKKQNRVADRDIALCSGVPTEWFERYMHQVEKIVNHASLLRWDQMQPSARAALSYLKQSDMRLVLVTLRHPHQVETFLRAQGLTHLVDNVYGASTTEAAHRNRVEHKRELLTIAIEQQELQGYCTDQSWMIGDTEADVIAAKAVGLPSAALSCGVRSMEYLSALQPTKLYTELFTAAQGVVETVALQTA
ncbi:MAG: HAD family hydrolase [Cyanobacteria bacterium J06560_2]